MNFNRAIQGLDTDMVVLGAKLPGGSKTVTIKRDGSNVTVDIQQELQKCKAYLATCSRTGCDPAKVKQCQEFIAQHDPGYADAVKQAQIAACLQDVQTIKYIPNSKTDENPDGVLDAQWEKRREQCRAFLTANGVTIPGEGGGDTGGGGTASGSTGILFAGLMWEQLPFYLSIPIVALCAWQFNKEKIKNYAGKIRISGPLHKLLNLSFKKSFT